MRTRASRPGLNKHDTEVCAVVVALLALTAPLTACVGSANEPDFLVVITAYICTYHWPCAQLQRDVEHAYAIVSFKSYF